MPKKKRKKIMKIVEKRVRDAKCKNWQALKGLYNRRKTTAKSFQK